jgi:hypothetical protein
LEEEEEEIISGINNFEKNGIDLQNARGQDQVRVKVKRA